VPGRLATEHDKPAMAGPAGGRGVTAQAVLDMAARGVRSSIARMPRSVHGEGDHHGLIARLIGIARDKGVSCYVGDGSSRWPAVHVLDAAPLARLAVEQAPAGSVLASSALTRELLGWRPVRPGLIEDLDKGHYFA
jgi:nucleoside-diphosphate-sugar epimerase